MADILRRLAAEAVGTLFLVAAVVGSGLMAQRLTDDVALQLLCNTAATVTMLAVLIATLAPISGAHLNPAVSLAMVATGELRPAVGTGYAVAQIVGGALGTVLAHLMFDHPAVVLSATGRSGAGQWLSEGVATFGLVAVILLAGRSSPQALPALVAAYIAGAYWCTASTSFANPAVTLARTLTDTFSGIRMIDAPAFILSQLAGALLAVAAVRLLRPETRTAAGP